ncbi:transcriptional repressor LexA [Lignipirellula cremea]|uniref:LexA repressor n=1 Tax=Lignipirellula cremea TaxID=2528010 RepID=A0A518E079_9BACT|nr:transcriptional repressor LexA [Lignipirellula cremea]QDU97494.1 LexA repressor [Lignipirellula cremea]
MSLDQLTRKQLAVYNFVRDLIVNRGYGPTVREIGTQFDISSPNGVVCHLKALEKKGLIRRDPRKSRAIELTEDPYDDSGLPLRGMVAAGVMREAIEDDQRINFADMFKEERNHFVLKVSGDSMIEAHIDDGDYVVVRKQNTANKGQMVVAQTSDGEATLKYWFPEATRIRLQPANSEMEPIYVKDASVLGVVVGVVRNYG